MINNKNIKIKDSFKAIFIVTFVFILTAIFKLFLFEENDESSIEEALRGIYWNVSITNFHDLFRGISHFYALLYSQFDIGVNYFGISLILLNWIAFVILSYLLLKKTNKCNILWLLLFIYIAYYNIYIVSFTRISILASFAGFLLFFYGLLEVNSKKIKFTVLLFSSLIILFAYLIRPKGSILAFVLCMPFFAWHVFFNDLTKRSFLVLLVALPILFSTLLHYLIINKFDPEPYCDHYAKVLDYGRTFTPENQEQEKILYEVKKWFLADKETQKLINYEYLLDDIKSKNVQLYNQKKYVLLIDRIIWQLKTYIFSPLNKNYPLLSVLLLFALLSSLIFIKKHLKMILLIYFFSACYFIIILFVFYYMKIEDRVIVPLLTVWIYFLILTTSFFSFSFFNKWSKYLMFSAIPILLIFIFLQFKLIKNDAIIRIEEAKYSLNSLKKYNSIQNRDVVFLTLINQGSNYYALKHIEWDRNKLQIPLFGWTSFIEQNFETLQRVTGSTRIKDVFTWIAINPDTASIYSNPSQNKILYKIFEYNDFNGELVPVEILDENSQDGFYKIILNNNKVDI